MSDPLHTDLHVGRTFPKEYSRLLFPVCGAHALWAPRLSQDGGGALGDVGMIVNGRFWKDFNVFEHDEEQNSSPLTLPANRFNRDQSYNTSIMSSSRDSTIEFHITGSTEIVGLPLQTLDVQPEVNLARAQDGLAFLAPPVPTRWDGMHPSLHIELGAWLATQCQTRPELEGRVIVTEVVRSSGYVGGLVLSRSTEVSANLSLGGAVTASAGGSIGQRRSLNAVLRGPDSWTPNMPADYTSTIILKYTTAVTRPGFLRRVGLKLGLSRPTPSSQSRGTAPGATSGTGAGFRGSTATAPSPNMPAQDSRQYDDASPPVECDSDEIYDPSPLTPFLDMILRRHTEVDIAVGNLSVLSEFLAVQWSLLIMTSLTLSDSGTMRNHFPTHPPFDSTSAYRRLREIPTATSLVQSLRILLLSIQYITRHL
ncbi:hypothetical protein EXIGLDRAFT_747306 [Exidia glandulosa HHB12029]|uniref:Uncharacterized protein n=1 Tax=Exidia glandulosa HHB12029 TaxID=1314781 RepID=A0A165KXG1_EXIGL|nr:hypothetical protein EXIGLDRAFT_747306 [Exidia glandulosa HHB12029]